MNKKFITHGILFFLIVQAIMPVILGIGPEFEPSLYVDDDNTDGPWDGTYLHPFQHIQDAIDFAIDGDVIYVKTGTYRENIVVDKSITLLGNNVDETIIDGNYTLYKDVATITAEFVRIKKFIIQNGYYHGIRIEADYANISSNVISNNNDTGIRVAGASYTSIRYNTITGNSGGGISGYPTANHNIISDNDINNNSGGGVGFGDSSNNIVHGNTIKENGGVGISISRGSDTLVFDNVVTNNGGEGVKFSDLTDSICYNNTITDNDDIGVVVYSDSSYCTVANNLMVNNGDERGIGLWDVPYCLISGNTITDQGTSAIDLNSAFCTVAGNILERCYRGIVTSGTSNIGNIIVNNTFRDNTFRGIDVGSGVSECWIYHNTFLNSGDNNAYDLSSNTDNYWDNGYPSGGNYWDDYTGIDSDGDDIGDSPYPIPPIADDHDHYPLMSMIEGLLPLKIHTPVSVLEGESFQVTVTSNDNPVEDVLITFGDETLTTDTNGIVTFTTPLVDLSAERWCSAYLSGYEYALNLITVEDTSLAGKQLEINTPDYAIGGESVQITITADNEPVEHVVSMFYFGDGSFVDIALTSTDGTATITIPIIYEEKELYIEAQREGYFGTYVVIPAYVTAPEPVYLNISAPLKVVEKQSFTVTIIEQDSDNKVEGAEVTFNGAPHQTDSNGDVVFTAPPVSENTTYTIFATHEEYEPDETTIIVLNDETAVSIQILSPNGGESWHDNETIELTISSSDLLPDHIITIQYQYAYGLWNTIVENRGDILTPYIWDTTHIPDGYPYIIKVILKKDDDLDGIYETLISEDSSDAPFAIDNSITNKGWLYGRVVEESNNITVPIEDAVVCIILSDINNVVTSKCTYTNESGEYIIPIRAGTYSVTASKLGYKTAIASGVMIWANETTELNFTLEPGTSSFKDMLFIEENRESIQKAIMDGYVSGEVTITQDKEPLVFIYNYDDDVSIKVKNVDDEHITIVVDGPEKGAGRGIVINLFGNFVGQKDSVIVKYDGKTIDQANNVPDALDPDDDGSHPEGLKIINDDGMQVIVTIPHFSEHTITISSAIETITGINALMWYLIFLIMITIAATIHMVFIWKK